MREETLKKGRFIMAKIILNGCFGGYHWSVEGIIEVLKRKGATNITVDDGFCKEVHGIINGEKVDVYNLDRKDPVAIQVLEEKGSKFCSSNFSNLYIEEYDENDFIADIDEYDGSETLELIPRITEKRIRACRNIDEVVELLRRTGVFVHE
jgi:hypothetical protein